MNRILYRSVLMSVLFFSGITRVQNSTCSPRVEYQSNEGAQENLESLCKPVTMTSLGINRFLHSVYNNPYYAQEILPNDFSHLIQFLENGFATKQSRAYVQSTLRLFTNKLKACSYVNAHAFNDCLEKLPSLLQPYFIVSRTYAIDTLRKRINNVLYAQFLEKFGTFKNDPHHFFDNLSNVILDEVDSARSDANLVSLEELRKTILIFLEVGLGKLMWSHRDKQTTWTTTKSMSEHLTTLLENSVLADSDDLNDLFVSLTERYCYFIDIAATDLPLSFYKDVTKDIMSTSLPLLDLEEQEEHIEPKAQRLLHALAKAEARCRAYNHGAIQPKTIPQALI